jgi:hypothetical protein
MPRGLQAAEERLVIANGDEAADVGNRVFLRAHQDRVRLGEELMHDLAERTAGPALFPLADEPGVLGEARDVHDELLAVAVCERRYLTNVGERHRLATARVVRDREHHDRDPLAVRPVQQLPESVHVHIAFERSLDVRIERFGHRQVECHPLAHLDVRPGRIEVRVRRDDLPPGR